MIKSMITEIREIYSDLDEEFHPILVPIATKITHFWADEVVDISLEVLKR